MRNISNDIGKLVGNLSERELVDLAEKILGEIPKWFVKNKETVDNNRKRMDQMAAEFNDRVGDILARWEEEAKEDTTEEVSTHEDKAA